MLAVIVQKTEKSKPTRRNFRTLIEAKQHAAKYTDAVEIRIVGDEEAA